MKKQLGLFALLLVLNIIPSMALASSFTLNSPATDKSIFYLGQIFGNMSFALTGTGSSLLSNLFQIFNIAVLTLGSIVVSYTIILSTINTAQEGEVMGKKWSSVWIPLRAALGIAFLVPTGYGYSILQITMMSIVIMGIGAGNQLWNQVINAMQFGTGVMGAITVNQDGLNTASQSLLTSMVCSAVFNGNETCRQAINNQPVLIYANGNNIYVGIQDDPNNSSLCGGLAPGALPQQVSDAATWTTANSTAIILAGSALGLAAQEIFTSTNPNTWTQTNVITASNAILQGGIAAAGAGNAAMSLSTQQADMLQKAQADGWIFAGSYYMSIVSIHQTIPAYPAPVPIPATVNAATQGNACYAAYAAAITNMNNYITKTTTQTTSTTTLNLGPNPSAGMLQKVSDSITAPLRASIEKFTIYLTTNTNNDPIASLASFGSDLMIVAEVFWFSFMLVCVVLLLGFCISSGISPLCAAVGGGIGMLLPLFTAILLFLWGIGATLGIYVPLIPYLVFTFTALSWMLLVIETIVAAPVVALGLVSPSSENLGRASSAVTLIMNVFLQPSLMVIGFIAAIKLLYAAIAMLNYGFSGTVNASTEGLGIFGTFALLGLYGAIVTTIINECFSLIHVLPAKVIRWIGGHAEQSGVKQMMEKAEKGFDTGKETATAVGKGVAGFVAKRAKDMKGDKQQDKQEKQEKKESEGEEGGESGAEVEGGEGGSGEASGGGGGPGPSGSPAGGPKGPGGAGGAGGGAGAGGAGGVSPG